MARYRKRPVEIEAFCTTDFAFPSWYFDALNSGKIKKVHTSCTGYSLGDPFCVVRTLEGDHLALYGDYIIKGIAGEIYPCKPDIFRKTYEQVPEGN